MEPFSDLKSYLNRWSGEALKRKAVAQTVLAIAATAANIAELVARGPLAGELSAIRGDNADGNTQKALDVSANDQLIDSLRGVPVGQLVSEELKEPLPLEEGAPLCVAIDPLDGSSDIETNTAVGTIFSVLPSLSPAIGVVDPAFSQPGTNQLAAGYVIYGPQTALVLTLGSGTQIFTHDRRLSEFRLTAQNVRVPATTREFAINVSNFRHWDRHTRAYIDDCLDGEDGCRNGNYNMRWLASLVAECHRIFSRGGVFLYPGDSRQAYRHGRVRLLYEANPIAFLVEQAGGSATTGRGRILELKPNNIHQRVPLIFGSRREIRRVEHYYSESAATGERSQLFNKRGLFRA